MLKPDPHTIPTFGDNSFSGSFDFKVEYVDSSSSDSGLTDILKGMMEGDKKSLSLRQGLSQPDSESLKRPIRVLCNLHFVPAFWPLIILAT